MTGTPSRPGAPAQPNPNIAPAIAAANSLLAQEAAKTQDVDQKLKASLSGLKPQDFAYLECRIFLFDGETPEIYLSPKELIKETGGDAIQDSSLKEIQIALPFTQTCEAFRNVPQGATPQDQQQVGDAFSHLSAAVTTWTQERLKEALSATGLTCACYISDPDGYEYVDVMTGDALSSDDAKEKGPFKFIPKAVSAPDAANFHATWTGSDGSKLVLKSNTAIEFDSPKGAFMGRHILTDKEIVVGDFPYITKRMQIERRPTDANDPNMRVDGIDYKR